MPAKKNAPTLEQWKRLYELMDQFSDLAPWEYMYEHNAFGVQPPEAGEFGFVSVMGNLGEHFAVSVYTGKKGFEGYLNIQRVGYKLTPDMLLLTPQLQASFEDVDMVSPEDRKIIKQLNLKFRGKKAWPLFRSYRPACIPWYLENNEAQLLIHALEQLMDVAPRFKKNPDMLEAPDSKEYLVRVYKNAKWLDQFQKIKFPQDPPLRLRMNMDALHHLKNMEKQNSIVEVDMEMMKQGIRDGKFDRPYFPFLFMIAEKHSGMILGVDMLSPLPSLEKMWEFIPEKVIESLASFILPKEIQVKDPLLALLLSPLEKEVGFKVNVVSRLPAIERAQKEFKKFQRK